MTNPQIIIVNRTTECKFSDEPVTRHFGVFTTMRKACEAVEIQVKGTYSEATAERIQAFVEDHMIRYNDPDNPPEWGGYRESAGAFSFAIDTVK